VKNLILETGIPVSVDGLGSKHSPKFVNCYKVLLPECYMPRGWFIQQWRTGVIS